MKVGSLESPVLVENTWAVAYDSGELGSAQTSITISGLNGNVDEEYMLICRFVSGAASSNFFLRPNNDSTAGIYGNQMLNGNNATAAAARDTSETYIWLSNAASASGSISFSETLIHTKSGYIRTCIGKSADNISTTTVTQVNLFGQSHNDTSNNYTSLVVLSDQASGIGVGSRIILLKKVTNTTGLKTGSLEVQGKVYGVWQKVYENVLTSIIENSTSNSNTALGDVGDSEYRRAQSFTLSSSATVVSVELKTGTASGSPIGNWTVKIETDNAGKPSGTLAHANATITTTAPGNNTQKIFTFAGSFSLAASTKYWIVVDCDNQSTGVYWLLAISDNSVFSSGGVCTKTNGIWGGEAGTDDLWFRLNDATAPTTSITISGLDGNTDVMYRLVVRVVNGYSGAVDYLLRFNNDAGINYGFQQLRGINTTVGALRGTHSGKFIANMSLLNQIEFSKMIFYVKSGYVRTSIIIKNREISGTTVIEVESMGQSWNNTTDNITSLVITASQTNGLGIGTYICLEKLVLS